jgi:Amylo-alpha-1,6-glucosidase
MSPDPVAEHEPILWESDHPRPERPALVTGLEGWGVLGGNGEFSWLRETRGARFDWGGVYVHGIRLTGPWVLQWGLGPEATPVRPAMTGIQVRRSRVTITRRARELAIREEVLFPPNLPGVARIVAVTSNLDAPATLHVESQVRPLLAPVLVEGLQPYEFTVEPLHGRLRVRAVGSSLVLDTDHPVERVRLDGVDWAGVVRRGGLARIDHGFTVELPAHGTIGLRFLLWGGVDGCVHPEEHRAAPGGWGASGDWVEQAATDWATWTAATPVLRCPDDPELEAGYGLARGALRSLYTRTEPEMQGLRAGYPWYGDIWGRDLAWALPAVLWMNDAEWAEASIRTAFEYQAPEDLPLLAATAGEIPMQLSPGPVFLYGTSDTSIYFFDRVRRWIAHTGQAEAILHEHREPLARLRRWLDRKMDPASRLITNGGEADRLRRLASVGSHSYGIDSPDMTIWDSADRRDHAVDVQVAALEAEEAYAELALGLGDSTGSWASVRRAEELRMLIRTRYAWAGERYLYDSLRRDGSALARVRPNALLAVSAGALGPAAAREVLNRALEPDLNAPWGLRTLSNRDPTYDPIAYHEGQVWPIATAWAAQAAFRVGLPERGVELLRVLARSYLREGGLANECYRGDRDEPWNSCCLLGFSVAPFLTTLFEGLWGLRPDLVHGKIAIEPTFPSAWREAELSNVVLGQGTLALFWRDGTLSAEWRGDRPLTVVHGGRETPLLPGTARVSLPRERT